MLIYIAGALVFWYGGRLVSYGELSSKQFFIIFSAIIFGGQSAGFMFGFTSSEYLHISSTPIYHTRF